MQTVSEEIKGSIVPIVDANSFPEAEFTFVSDYPSTVVRTGK